MTDKLPEDVQREYDLVNSDLEESVQEWANEQLEARGEKPVGSSWAGDLWQRFISPPNVEPGFLSACYKLRPYAMVGLAGLLAVAS